MTADKQGLAGGAVPGQRSPGVRRPPRGVLYVLVALIATAIAAVIVTMCAFFLSFYSWMAGAAIAAGGLVLAIPVWRWRGSRSAAGALAAGSIIAAAVLFPVWRSEYAHEQALSDLKNRLCDGAVPPRTEILECGDSVSLTGNGNHCDYQAWMVMSSTLTKQELVAFFQRITIRGIGGQALPFAGEGNYRPTWLTEGPIGVSLRVMSENPDTLTARVLVYDPLYDEGNDFRCM
jgi:hypothetical protein